MKEACNGARLNAILVIVYPLLLTLVPSGCATYEPVLSRTLKPVLFSKDVKTVNLPITLFRARVQMDRLEVWTRVTRTAGDYRTNFDYEIEGTAALCMALVKDGRIFEHDWKRLVLEMTCFYVGKPHFGWSADSGGYCYTSITVSRETLIELRKRNLPASEYPEYWEMIATRIGPPDFVSHEWSPTHADKNPGM